MWPAVRTLSDQISSVCVYYYLALWGCCRRSTPENLQARAATKLSFLLSLEALEDAAYIGAVIGILAASFQSHVTSFAALRPLAEHLLSSWYDAGPTLHESLAASTSSDSKSVRIAESRLTDVVSAIALPHLALIIMGQTCTLREFGLRSEWRLAQLRVNCSSCHSWLACCGFCAGEQLARIGFYDLL